MSPTIQAGSTLVFDRLSEKDKIKRNDIVCFHPPINNKWIFCMRVIGIPGDLITIDPGKQTLIVQKGHGKEQTVIPLHSDNKVVEGIIQEGFFFLVGDNLEHANDSRYFGLVTRDSIFGRVKDILSN
jgi:signal peptidase I